MGKNDAQKMKVQVLPINDLLPADYNPRKDLSVDDKEYRKLKKSIKKFGYVDPIIYNLTSGNVVGGHQRLKVLKDLGYKEVDVVVVELDEMDERALNVALNQISGAWDLPRLKDLFELLDNGSYDIENTGFEMDEIETLMTQFHKPEKETEKKEKTCPECGAILKG
jgi:ParB-like chromosome segregation protein Spo0J